MTRCALLVVSKAPVPGQAKTRLSPALSPGDAAELASASLRDTLQAVRAAPVATRIVALTGDLGAARHGAEIAGLLHDFVVIPQRGAGFARRLVNAHADASAIGRCPVLQIGMDTPQVTPELLGAAAATLARTEVDAVFGAATDGGWWALGVTSPTMAEILADIAPSRRDTGACTLHALRQCGCRVTELAVLSDVDTLDDARRVSGEVAEGSSFRAVFRALSRSGRDDVG
ncbi:DUF2064 domain-containing protein [Rhodococcus spelaei]|uniref:DUF2064 domain-containing protein n=1 Tax=Rhodococcus spelaei TaxID=2546320 RepID=A0A541B816_9NOCA|nr:DUF2064 domain-containing protein [Rhodococcus spelaei]